MNNKVPDNSVIMGIDPGTNITGFGVIRINNNQNFFIVLLLGLLHFLNFLRNRLLLILRIKKSLNW